LAVEREGSRARVEALDREVADWKARADIAEVWYDEIKGECARRLFLRLEEEKASWEGLMQRQMHEEQLSWDEERARELELTLSKEMVAWEARIAEEWEARSNEVKTEVERRTTAEWTERLRREPIASASVASDRGANERTVNVSKRAGYVKRGFRPNIMCPISIWLGRRPLSERTLCTNRCCKIRLSPHALIIMII